MATWYARKSAEFGAWAGSNSTVWATASDGSTYMSGASLAAVDITGDTFLTDGYTISIARNITCVELQATTGPGGAGGSFTTASAYTITAKITHVSGTATAALVCSHSSPNTVALSRQVQAGPNLGVYSNGTGLLSVSECDVKGGSATNAYGIQAAGRVAFTNCNFHGGSGTNTPGYFHGQAAGVTDSTITGGSMVPSLTIASPGISINGRGSLTISGGTVIHGSGTTGFAAHGIKCSTGVGVVTIDGCSIDGGHTAGACGISIETFNVNGAFAIANCTITAGTAGTAFAIQNMTRESVTLTACNIINNTYTSAIAGQVLFLPGAANYIEYPYAAAPSVYYYAKTIIAGNVLSGVNGDGSTVPATGTYHAPEAYEVVSDAVFGPLSAIQGNVTNPLEVFVLNGIDYGAYGTQYHGALTLPAEAQVLKNISYGQGSGLTGQLEPGGGALVGPSALISG